MKRGKNHSAGKKNGEEYCEGGNNRKAKQNKYETDSFHSCHVTKQKGGLQQLMTGTTDRYGFYQTDHRKFGGMIHPSDYNTTYANKNTASRIESDRKFDEQCRKNTLRQKQLHKEDSLIRETQTC